MDPVPATATTPRARPAGRSGGFTLIELLISLVIVAVLASLAYPAYTRYVERAHRAQARAALLEAVQYLERHYATHNSYANATLPDRLLSVPEDADAQARYTLSVTATEATYVVTARRLRQDPSESGALADTDPCGDLGVDQLGQRTASNAVDAARRQDRAKLAECWR